MKVGDRAPVTLEAVEPAADLLRSLSNPQRLAIVCTLVEGERAVSELEAELGIRQPSLSQHLGTLREAGLIVGRREVKAVFYRIGDPRAAQLVEALHAIFCAESARPPLSPRRVSSRMPAVAPPRRSEAAMFARVGDDA